MSIDYAKTGVPMHLRMLGDFEAEMAERLATLFLEWDKEEVMTEIIEHLPNVIRDAKTHRDDAVWKIADAAYVWAALWQAEVGRRGRPRVAWRALATKVGLSPKTLEAYARTAATFPPTGPDDPWHRRAQDEYLTFEHHRLCAHSDDPLVWLQKAEAENMSTAQLRRAIDAAEALHPPEACPERERVVWCVRQEKRVEPEECDGCLLRGRE